MPTGSIGPRHLDAGTPDGVPGWSRRLGALFARLRKPDTDEGTGARPSDQAQVHATRGLPRFLTGLSDRDQPSLLDLGPVVGANVSYFGEELGCRMVVEDLAGDVDRHARESRIGELPAFFETRFRHAPDCFDGILCWDVFDYLDRPSGLVLARQLVRLLRPGGVVLAFFNHVEKIDGAPPRYMRHTVLDRRTLEYRPYGTLRPRQRPLLNRDIQRMFEPLTITDQFLQRNSVREVVLRKPSTPGHHDGPTS